MLKTRVLSAIVLIPIVFALIYLGGYWFSSAIVIAAILALYEGYRMMGVTIFPPLAAGGLLLELALLLTGNAIPQQSWLTHVLTGGVLLTLVIALFDSNPKPATRWSLTVASALYLGWLMHYFIALRNLPNGLAWVLVALLTTWTIDSGAYFVGLSLGKHKLWPRLSPKKTWEGVIGGFVAGIIGAIILARILLPHLSWTQGLWLGVTASFVDPFGDLSVSMFKREAGAKDSSKLIPGHGGMLDRLDSLLFVVPIVFYYASLWGG